MSTLLSQKEYVMQLNSILGDGTKLRKFHCSKQIVLDNRGKPKAEAD